MSDHEDVLRDERARIGDMLSDPLMREMVTEESVPRCEAVMAAIDATLAELSTLRAEVGILSAAKAGARYIAERDTLRQRLAEVERIGRQFERDARKHFEQSCENLQRAERAEREIACRDAVIKDHLAKILHLENRVDAEAFRAERAETALRDTRCCLHVQGHWDCAVTHARARADLAPVAEPAKCSRCDGSGEVQCGPPSDGPIPCPKCAPVAEQPQPAIPHMLLVLTHKQTTGGCARCGKDWPCPDAPQPAKASTEPPDHV
jgi:hypothetical protein